VSVSAIRTNSAASAKESERETQSRILINSKQGRSDGNAFSVSSASRFYGPLVLWYVGPADRLSVDSSRVRTNQHQVLLDVWTFGPRNHETVELPELDK
jgi:hypothetical protein